MLTASYLILKPIVTLPGCKRSPGGAQDEPACASVPEASGAERQFNEGGTTEHHRCASAVRQYRNKIISPFRLPAVVRRRRQHVRGENARDLQAGQRFPEQPGPPGLRRQGEEGEEVQLPGFLLLLSKADFSPWTCDQGQDKGEQEKELVLQDETSSRVWVCTSTHSSTKVMVLDASQPSDLLDSFYACNTHVVCIASVPGRPGAAASTSFHSFSQQPGFVISHPSLFPSLPYQACWSRTTLQGKRSTRTWSPARVTACRWRAAWLAWAPLAATAPWLPREPPPSPRRPVLVPRIRVSSRASPRAQVLFCVCFVNYSCVVICDYCIIFIL